MFNISVNGLRIMALAVRAVYEVRRPFVAHANWLEIGWALRRQFWGRGYAAEIGRAGLAFAFGVLGAQTVVSCTARHNLRSRAVMERIGMRYAGEIRTRGMAEGGDGEQATRRMRCACCCEQTGTRRLLRPSNP
jgi:RimJ/RimL family protein N-acetyltransferase